MERFVRRSNKTGASSLTNSIEARLTLTTGKSHNSMATDPVSLSDGELLKDDGDGGKVSPLDTYTHMHMHMHMYMYMYDTCNS